MHPRRILTVFLTIAILLAIPVGQALAYGSADQPLAQIEFSGNCNNPSFPFCAPPPAGVGTGGLWFWVEIDAGGTGDLSGAVCGHTIGGVGGPGGAGAGSIRSDITWHYSTGVPAGVESFATDPGNQYYVVDLAAIGESFAFPVTQGHYSFHPVNGVAIEITIAP